MLLFGLRVGLFEVFFMFFEKNFVEGHHLIPRQNAICSGKHAEVQQRGRQEVGHVRGDELVLLQYMFCAKWCLLCTLPMLRTNVIIKAPPFRVNLFA